MFKNKGFILLLLILIAGWFYWFQLRPSQIRQKCHQWIIDRPGDLYPSDEDDRAEYNALYTSCLHSKGL